MLRILIADDEPLAREGLLHLLESEPDVELVGACADGKSALAAITELRPDIVFLDVQMPRGTGFDVVAQLPPDGHPVIIFVTAYDQYAVRAFDACAFDYLVKPFTDERFKRSLERARRQVRSLQTGELAHRVEGLLTYVRSLEAPVPGDVGASPAAVAPVNTADPATASPARDYVDRIVLKTKGDLHFIKARDVQWIEAEGDFVKVHAGGQSQLVRETLQSMEAKLDPARFLRIHRSFLVNAEHIRKVVPALYGDYHVFLGDGTKLRLSRSYRSRFKSSMLPPE